MARLGNHLTLVSSGQIQEPLPKSRSRDRLVELFAPLDTLLSQGGDDRLAVSRATKLNMYGCSPRPRPAAIAFSSSTACSISERAYRHALRARERLIEEAATQGLFEAFETHIEHTRHSLRAYLGLETSGAEVVFSPSGTDSQLHALYFARLVLGGPLSSIIVGSDQTGSGTAFTSGALHFSSRTARGHAVLKGSNISGWSGDVRTREIPFITPQGAVRSEAEMDELVFAAVAAEIQNGRRVVLQAMSSSKFGWRAPSESCLAAIAQMWPQSVQIVIDACQMRTSRSRIQSYLKRGYLVLITGSKFFTGPPFSGALLVPKNISDRIAIRDSLPDGLFDYADRSDLPCRWSSARCDLDLEPNFGQWLRWEAALLEMRDYFALPQSYRQEVIAGVSEGIGRLFASFGDLMPYSPRKMAAAGDEEFSEPTIFPFLIERRGVNLDFAEMTGLYHALNRDVSKELRACVHGGADPIASRLCHIGQPARVVLPGGNSTAALRIAVGSRTLVEAWSPGENASTRAIQNILAQVSLVLQKIDLHLKAAGLAPATPMPNTLPSADAAHGF